MKTLQKFKLFYAAALFAIVATAGCATISTFDQYAYAQTTSLKVEALNLMDKATESYASHTAEVDDVNIKFQKAYEYEKNRPKNEITTKMWQLMMSDSSHLYGGFVKFWKEQDKVSKAFITEAKQQVSENFDRIAELESKKITK